MDDKEKKEVNDYMTKIANETHALGIAPTPQNQMQYMMYKELRKLNINMEELLSKLKK